MPSAISSRTQLRALASPARQELLDLLSRIGPASAADLSLSLRRPADGLYYHLRVLQKAGLVRSVHTKTQAGRSETKFRSVSRMPAVNHDTRPGGNSPEVTAIVRSMLRLGSRDFARAAASGEVRTHGSRRELWALRSVGWLSASDLEDVNRRMRGLRDAAGRPRPEGRLYSITILLTPLDHRARKKQRSPRKESSR